MPTTPYASEQMVAAVIGTVAASDSAAINLFLAAASQTIDRETGRRFDKVTETRVFDTHYGPRLLVGDLVSVTTATSDNPSKGLDQALQLVVRTKDSDTSGCANGNGTVLYTGDLAGTATSRKLIGDAASGSQSGDRALAVNGSEVLCFRVSLPLSASNAVAGANTTATFTFDAEQTANN